MSPASNYRTGAYSTGVHSTGVHSTGAHPIPRKATRAPAMPKMEKFRQRLEKAKAEQDLSYFTAVEGKKAGVWFNDGKTTRLVGSFYGDAGPEIRKFWYSQDCTPENLVNKISR